jgi:parallel beta-helix repeat protein
LGAGLVNPARAVSGARVITADTTLNADIVVDSLATLTIRPGVTVCFAGYHALIVRGLLVAEGTAAKPIRLTATGRPHDTRERPGWQGLSIQGKNALARLRHCRIEGAFANAVWEASVRIDSCQFVGNYRGFYCGRGASPQLRGCLISRNLCGLTVNASTPLLIDNTISGNDVGLSIEAGATPLIGRNTIRDNTVDVQSDSTLGANRGTLSTQKYWDVVRQLY